ncbi:hypothetical protein N7494_000395 [Penicillium frequentans]|uniref:Uncharacterized protein n=1 Tax=Penicillium frequentans TaxID=3151616 RepID=A0AAD6D5Q2_9EURO|nr:hypothetical protein N7494_000395 [Penicillium glabrum]
MSGLSLREASEAGASEPGHNGLKRNFTFWSALGLAVCCSGAWEGWTASLSQGIQGGSAVGLFYGWILVAIGITCVASSLAELARYYLEPIILSQSLTECLSMWPSAGGQYVWVSHLAPPWCRGFLVCLILLLAWETNF